MRKVFIQLFVALAMVAIALPAQAQKKITNGFVKYELVDILGDNLPPQASMMKGSKMDVYFSGEKQQVFMSFMGGMMQMKVIKTGKDDPGILLTDMMGKKVKVKQEKESSIENKVKDLKVEVAKGEDKTIAGYKCKKANLMTPKGEKIEIYFTDKIKPAGSYFDKIFPGLDGFPMEYRIVNQGITMVYSALEVGDKVADGTFDVPEGYVEKTAEEFEKEMGGLGNLGF
ncbi:MAG: hypothetical protein AAF990_10865 [Bacteroidota bacterium]